MLALPQRKGPFPQDLISIFAIYALRCAARSRLILRTRLESILGRRSLPPKLSSRAAVCNPSQSRCPCVPRILRCPSRLLSLCPMNPGHRAIPLQPPSALPPSHPTASPSSDLSGSSWHPSRTPYLWLLESAEHSSCDRSSAGPCHRAAGKLICSSSRCAGDGHVCRARELSATQPHPLAHGGKVSFKRTRKPALWPLSKVTTASKDQGPVQVKLKVKCVSGGGFPLWLALAKF